MYNFMLKTLGIIDARYTTETQRQTAGRRLEGKSVLEWVARETTDCMQLSGVIILTNDLPENDFVVNLAPSDVPVHRTAVGDHLRALADTLEKYPAESCVWIASDWPFLDATLVDKLVVGAEKQECDFASFQGIEGPVNQGYPTGLLPIWFRTSALFEADRHARKVEHRECPCRYFLSRSHKYRSISLAPPARKSETPLCFRIDGAEDWENALELFDAMKGEDFHFEKIADFMSQYSNKA
jgi:spore coat polysaccharide biosynthesis protein SpsF (cytidylyltransferase family)